MELEVVAHVDDRGDGGRIDDAEDPREHAGGTDPAGDDGDLGRHGADPTGGRYGYRTVTDPADDEARMVRDDAGSVRTAISVPLADEEASTA